ncbi:MAG: hypothetical protein OFPII_20750 [Osedax symbiont Rs1]|nr:MAG: hypothetical protein OFPII_20750 [Osedax symbiont Rs1]
MAKINGKSLLGTFRILCLASISFNDEITLHQQWYILRPLHNLPRGYDNCAQ